MQRKQAASPVQTVKSDKDRLPTIEVAGVSKWYGDVVAVSEVSFGIGPGVTALLGPNGAGKSTIFKMLAGLVAPSTGTVRVLGRPARGDTALYRRIALIPEQDSIYPFLTGRQFVRLNAVLQGVADADAATERALATVGLQDDAGRAIGGYSKGMRQRAKIAAALTHEPAVLIMDEPLNGTDPIQRARLIELIKRLGAEGHTVVVSSHILHEVERFADRVLVIVNGKLAAAGDYHTIRDKIDEHAHLIQVRASEPRRLAAALVGLPALRGVRLAADDAIVVETDDVREFYRRIAQVAKAEGVHLYEVAALDDSLTSVVAYITER
ncbi:MAG: ABC transporter ATP-binding protein [Chloroflexota bacterium]